MFRILVISSLSRSSDSSLSSISESCEGWCGGMVGGSYGFLASSVGANLVDVHFIEFSFHVSGNCALIFGRGGYAVGGLSW